MSRTVVHKRRSKVATGKGPHEWATEYHELQLRLRREFELRDAERHPGGWRLPPGPPGRASDIRREVV